MGKASLGSRLDGGAALRVEVAAALIGGQLAGDSVLGQRDESFRVEIELAEQGPVGVEGIAPIGRQGHLRLAADGPELDDEFVGVDVPEPHQRVETGGCQDAIAGNRGVGSEVRCALPD